MEVRAIEKAVERALNEYQVKTEIKSNGIQNQVTHWYIVHCKIMYFVALPFGSTVGCWRQNRQPPEEKMSRILKIKCFGFLKKKSLSFCHV